MIYYYIIALYCYMNDRYVYYVKYTVQLYCLNRNAIIILYRHLSFYDETVIAYASSMSVALHSLYYIHVLYNKCILFVRNNELIGMRVVRYKLK